MCIPGMNFRADLRTLSLPSPRSGTYTLRNRYLVPAVSEASASTNEIHPGLCSALMYRNEPNILDYKNLYSKN